MDDINVSMYIIISPKNEPELWTLSRGKSECLRMFKKHLYSDWNYCRAIGWKCIKVDVNIVDSVMNRELTND